MWLSPVSCNGKAAEMGLDVVVVDVDVLVNTQYPSYTTQLYDMYIMPSKEVEVNKISKRHSKCLLATEQEKVKDKKIQAYAFTLAINKRRKESRQETIYAFLTCYNSKKMQKYTLTYIHTCSCSL